MKYVLGIDIGGTSIKLGIVRVGETADIVAQHTVPMDPKAPAAEIVRSIANAATVLMGPHRDSVAGVGVGCPGLIARDTGRVLKSPNLPTLVDYPVRDELHQLLGLPVEIQNDANAAALGELLFGSHGVRNLILLTLGTGVGGGVIADGKLLLGADNAAAELGHLKVEFADGQLCGCGRRGCLEAYVGSKGIARLALAAYAASLEPPKAVDVMTTKDLSQAARNGDGAAQKALHQAGEYLGRGIAQLIDTFNPEKILIGGGASAALDLLRPGIDRAVQQYASFDETRDLAKIERATLGADPCILGAAATFLHTQDASPLPQRAVVLAPAPLPSQLFVLCIHIGASSSQVGVLNDAGEVVVAAAGDFAPEARKHMSYADLIAETADLVKDILPRAEALGASRRQLRAGAVVAPVPVNRETGRTLRAPALHKLDDVPLASHLQREIMEKTGLNVPFVADNDAKGACLAEHYFGAGRPLDNFLLVLLCTGLGGAMFLNGDLYQGNNRVAGEIGHVTAQPEGRLCGCGSRGCLETVVSWAALLHRLKEQGIPLPKGADTGYADLISAARSDKAIRSLFQELGYYLGIGLAGFINLLNPSQVILSGSMTRAHDLFWPAADQELQRRVFPGFRCPVAPTTLLDHCELKATLSAFLYSRRTYT